jgi:hypothetical protein
MEISTSRSFAANVTAPARARTWLDDLLVRRGSTLPLDGALLTSELVADAVHRAAQQVIVKVDADDAGLRVEVSDADPELLSVVDDAPLERALRRRAVQALATRWGAEGDRYRTAAWFELRTA